MSFVFSFLLMLIYALMIMFVKLKIIFKHVFVNINIQ